MPSGPTTPQPTPGPLRAHVYVDGFNLYYGSLRGTPYKWLDLVALARRLLPRHDIRRVVYCTARIKHNSGASQAAARRQATYLDALRSLPEVRIVYGHFLTQTVRRPNADGSGFTNVLKTEEKGSDVNLATHLLADAFGDQFDVALVITNDSDLVAPIRMVGERKQLPVGVAFPLRRGRRASRQLSQHAKFLRSIRASALRSSQLPPTVTTPDGRTLTKPTAW